MLDGYLSPRSQSAQRQSFRPRLDQIGMKMPLVSFTISENIRTVLDNAGEPLGWGADSNSDVRWPV
jgi:hypothetical protein